jgi:hypothetical protein
MYVPINNNIVVMPAQGQACTEYEPSDAGK